MTSIREKICLVVGMTFFWTYFRFQTVIQTMFHKSEIVPFPGDGITAITAFLLMLVVLAGCLAFAAEGAERILETKPLIPLGVSALGSVGILLNYSLGTSGFTAGGTIVFWVSTALFVAGFLANYVSWGHYCSRYFNFELICLLALSFVLSLILFSAVISTLPAVKRVVVPCIPFICELMWFLACIGTGKQPTGEGETASAIDNPIPQSKLVYILLFVTFLLCGSFIRGIVDLQGNYTNVMQFRLYASLIILGLIALYCLYRYHRFKASVAKEQDGKPSRDPLTPHEQETQEADEAERLTLTCWMLLALVFFCGLLQAFIVPESGIGGHLVVVARSGLDFLLWALLCNIVHAEKLHATRIFVLFSVFVEAISWLISYTLIPAIYAAGRTEPERLVEIALILIMFLLVAALTILFAWVALRRQSVFDKTPAEKAAEITRESIPETLTGKYKLTSREVEVISLFAQGYSLSKVSQELYISLGTAQSHIKNIYRKLDVHSKDELITLIDSWKSNWE